MKGDGLACAHLQVFRPHIPPEALALVAVVLDYTPTARLTAFQTLAHPFFDELRQPGTLFDGTCRDSWIRLGDIDFLTCCLPRSPHAALL
jgi:hypothetical protein